MKTTLNRRLILHALTDDGGETPPFSAGTIAGRLEDALAYGWQGYEALKAVPAKTQIYRTLRDLLAAGVIVGTRCKDEMSGNGLPFWVVEYQLAADVDKNALIAACRAVYRKVDKAKHGINLFGSAFDMGLPANEVNQLSIEVKRLLQKTHPDKVGGFDDQFKQMIECRDWIKSGIPLPTPTHSTTQRQPKSKQIN
jgi:hypothetical protein